MKNEIGEKYGLTVEEAAKKIGVCERKVRWLIAEQKIPYYRVGRSVRIAWPELEKWLCSGGTDGGAS